MSDPRDDSYLDKYLIPLAKAYSLEGLGKVPPPRLLGRMRGLLRRAGVGTLVVCLVIALVTAFIASVFPAQLFVIAWTGGSLSGYVLTLWIERRRA